MNDFEDEIRAMLTARAGDIASAPPLLASAHDGARAGGRPDAATRPRQPGRWLVAATVAAVLAVAGGVLGVRLWLAEGSGNVPAGPTPASSVPVTLSPTTDLESIATTTGQPPVTMTDSSRVTQSPESGAAAACTAAWPASWQAALAAPGTAYGAESARPLGVAADGTVLVARDFGQGKARDLVLVRPGVEPTVAFTVSDPQQTNIESAALVGDELVVSIGSDPRLPRGQEPGSSPMPNVSQILVIDLPSDAQRVIASSKADAAGPAKTIDTVVVIGGTVYWDVRASYDVPAGTIESYDLAAKTRRAAYSGPAVLFYDGLDVSAAGITVGGTLVVRAGLPAAVDDAVPADDQRSVQTDGTAYAWVAGPQEIGWWRPGAESPSYVRLPEVLPQDTYPNLLAVAGSLVVIGGSTVLDMTTAAITSLPEDAAPLVDIGRGTFFTASRAGTGHFDDDGYWVDPSQLANLIELSGLPGLTCG